MKKIVAVVFIILVIIICGIIFINKQKEEIEVAKAVNSEENIVEEKFSPIPAIIINSTNTKQNNVTLDRGTRVNIIDEKEDEYIIGLNDTKDCIDKKDVYYFKFNKDEKYSLAIDVSEFNIVGKESPEYSSKIFKDNIDFAKFIIDNNINYSYLRIGGRGWGSKGNMYYDDNVKLYIDICEYLKIPYGFYFIEEALNEEEVLGEVQFVKDFIDQEKLEFNVLPLALDLEYQDGKGRTDNTWENRVPLVNMLVNEFKKIGIDTILYANGARIETYLKNANCKFWTAMYIKDDKIPKDDYKTVIQKEEAKIKNNPELINNSFLNTDLNKKGTNTVSYSDEYLNKVVGWQFTEDGAKEDGITTYVDLSILNNEYFSKFYEQ